MNCAIYPEVSYFVSKHCSSEWMLAPHRIHVYSMLFIEEGSANYLIDGVVYQPQKGDILCIKSGSFREASTTGMDCIGIDYTLPFATDIDLPVLTSWGDFESFHPLFQDLKLEWMEQKEGFNLKSNACLMLILHKLIYEKKDNSKNIHVELMKRFMIDNHKQELSVSIIASVVSLSPVYCGALFKKTENCTIAEFLTRVRINRAMVLLETGEYSISTVAFECGFTDIYYFSNTFKKMVGLSPSKYKNSRLI